MSQTWPTQLHPTKTKRPSKKEHISEGRRLSQFYTKPTIADFTTGILLEYLQSTGKDPIQMYFVECSTGEGALVKSLIRYGIPSSHIICIDVDEKLPGKCPEIDYIIAPLEIGGFLALTKEDLGLSGIPNSNIVVYSNPPYSDPRADGRSRIISLDFLNHAAEMADTVAFILGCTFRRHPIQTKINPFFHIAEYDGNRLDLDLPKDSYTLDGQEAPVSTVFQIWEKRRSKRAPHYSLSILKNSVYPTGEWMFVKCIDPRANLRIRNWGAWNTVGVVDSPQETKRIVQENIRIHRSGIKKSDPDNSHFYLYVPEDPVHVMREFQARKHLFEQVAHDRTLGMNPDISKADFAWIYSSSPDSVYKAGEIYEL